MSLMFIVKLPHPLTKSVPGLHKTLKSKKNTLIISYDIRKFFPKSKVKREGDPNYIQGNFPNLIKYSEKVSGEI